MFKKCLLVSVMLHIVLIIGAGLNSLHPSSYVQPVYFQLVSTAASEPLGVGGQSSTNGQTGTYPKNKTVFREHRQKTSAQKYGMKASNFLQVQQNEIRKNAETKITDYDTGSSQIQTQEGPNVHTVDRSLSMDNPGSSGETMQLGEGVDTNGEGLGGAGTSQGRSTIKQAQLKTDFKRVYPQEAREKGWEGTVKFEAALGKDGYVRTVTLIQSSGYKVLDDAAKKAIKKWHYQPATQDGKPIEWRVRINYVFNLEE
jgi:TonB family protein